MGKETFSDTEQKTLAGLFLCSDQSNEMLAFLKPEWNKSTALPLSEKLIIINYPLLIKGVFPWREELSSGIEYQKFCESFFIQPDLFLRIRPGHAESVLLKLNALEVKYEFISPFSIRLPNSFKVDKHFELDKEVVVQDYSSQRVGEYMELVRRRPSDESLKLWDCCAGSGGKSIMAYDHNPSIELAVSDVRKSILANLENRFKAAEIKKYKSFKADLAHSQFPIPHSPFDFIIADVPCSGSGTWSRTPEQLAFFDKKEIESYSALQKRIVDNIIPQLQPGGHLLYITCSVFKKENEEVVEYIKQNLPAGKAGFHLQVKKMELLKGYEIKADTMFAALLQKPL